MYKLVNKQIAQQRYDICKQCPRLSVLKICEFCNCIMPIKVKFALAECPAKKWSAVTDQHQHQIEEYENLE